MSKKPKQASSKQLPHAGKTSRRSRSCDVRAVPCWKPIAELELARVLALYVVNQHGGDDLCHTPKS